MIVRELITKLGFQTDAKGVNKFEQTLGRIKTALGAVASYYILRKITNTISNFVKETVGYYDELGESAQKLGVTTEALQKFRYSANISGVAAETLGTGIGLLSKNFEAAKTGSKEAIEAFAGFGIKNFKQFKTTEDLLLAISKAMEKMPDGPKKVALAMKVFGRSGKEVIPLLNNSQELQRQWRELEQMGGIATREQIEAGDRMDKLFKNVNMKIKVLWLSIGTQLLPKVERLVTEFSTWVVSDDAKMFIKDLSFLVEKLAGLLEILALSFKGLSEFVSKILPGGRDIWEDWKTPNVKAWWSRTKKSFWDFMLPGGAAEAMGAGPAAAAPAQEAKEATTVAPEAKLEVEKVQLPKGGYIELPEIIPQVEYLSGLTPATAPAAMMSEGKTQNISVKNDYKIEINGAGITDPALLGDIIKQNIEESNEEASRSMAANFAMGVS